jgi:hypothetical protein
MGAVASAPGAASARHRRGLMLPCMKPVAVSSRGGSLSVSRFCVFTCMMPAGRVKSWWVPFCVSVLRVHSEWAVGASLARFRQAWHAGILDGEVLDRRVGVHELPVEVAHDGEQRRDHRAQAARQGQGLNTVDNTLRAAGRDAVALLTEQGRDERDVARARPDEGVPDQQPAPHMALGIGEAVGGAVGAEPARLSQGAGIAPVALDLAGARRIHGGEVGIGDDDLVAEGLEAASHPLAVGRGLDQDPGAGPGAEHGGEALGFGADALLDDLTVLGEDVDLAFPLVHVDANCWPLLLPAALTAGALVGQRMPPRQAGRPAGFILSTLRR